MSQDCIQVNYEQLQDVARRFQAQADSCAELRTAVRRGLHPLQQGGWIGKGSHAFFSEMDSDIFPALDRLHSAMTHGEAVAQEAIAIFKAAEEDAGRLFQSDAGSTGDDSDNVQPGSPANPSGKQAEDLFKESYMDEMLNHKPWAGEGDPRLAWAMTVLRQNPLATDREKALDIIADLRGLKRSDVAQQYEMFRDLQGKAQRKAKDSKQPIQELMPVMPKPEILALMTVPPLSVVPQTMIALGLSQMNYMGSRDQLRFGQIVGDKFGIDPVFGAMLNPTGGMPGPGDLAIPTGESALSYHSAFHDAAGFLHTYFDEGPGYNYLGMEDRSRDNPLTGQESGIAYWNAKFLAAEFSHGRLDSADITNAVVTVGGGVILGTVEDAQETWDWVTKKIQGK